MPKLTYKAQTSDDPVMTRVGNYSFEHGKAVEVDDATYERLKSNPFFSGGRGSRQQEAAPSTMAPGPDSGIDSSIMPSYPPGGGMKYATDTAMTADGLKPSSDVSETDLVDNANTVEDPKEARKAGRVASKG